MRKLEKSVVLVGMMGSGKSAIGRRLATVLKMPFRDADAEIEAAAGMTMNEIFARLGEAAFRDGERKVVARLLDEPPQVLATGGGAFIDDGTRASIKAKAISVWLKADLPLLVERVSRKDSRPLLKNGNSREVLEKLLHAREPIYALADITVESDGSPHEMMVNRIVAALEKKLASLP
jgi:shikimate kinase